MPLFKCPDHFFNFDPSICFNMSPASMESDRSGCKAILGCRNQLDQGPPKRASVASKICSRDSAGAASNPAVRSKSNSRAKMKLKLIMIAKGFGCMTSLSSVKEARAVRFGGPEARRTQSEKKRRDQKFDQRTDGMSRRRTPNEAEVSPAIAHVCCGPGILFSSDASFVDCIQSRRRPAAVTTKQAEVSVGVGTPLNKTFDVSFVW